MCLRNTDRKRLARNTSGFTLAELIIASTLISLVMAGVCFAFNTSIRTWRRGEADLQAYQDARIALSILSRELECVVSGSEYLFEGDHNELEFYALAPPMYVEEDEGPRVLWVRYRTTTDPEANTTILVREEALVESALPIVRPDDRDHARATPIVERGKRHKFELASDVMDFEIRYIWMPALEPEMALERQPVPEWIAPVVEDENPAGAGLPQALRIALTVADPNTEAGQTTFTSFVAFRGPTTRRTEDQPLLAGGSGL